MIKDIEELSAKLDADVLAELRSLADGKIRVVECWPDQYIAAKTAKVNHSRRGHRLGEQGSAWANLTGAGIANGIREPLADAAQQRNWSENVGPERRVARKAGELVAGKNLYWITTLSSRNSRDLPAAHELISVERQFVDRTNSYVGYRRNRPTHRRFFLIALEHSQL